MGVEADADAMTGYLMQYHRPQLALRAPHGMASGAASRMMINRPSGRLSKSSCGFKGQARACAIHEFSGLGSLLPTSQIEKPAVKDLLSLGCGTVMHVISLQAPAREDDDHLKDLDFTPTGIVARWNAGRDFIRRQVAAAPWNEAVAPAMGIVVHR